jgi:GNAT superfamily N-acetyltransferase
MLEIQRTSLTLSSLLQSPDYSSLIHPSILSSLTTPSFATRWVAIEARLAGELVGLLLSEIYPLLRIAQLYSLVVKPKYRHQGIGRQLFAFAEDWLVQEEQVQSIELIYDQTDPFAAPLEKIMASLGWPSAKLFLIRCHFDAYTFNPPWIHLIYHLPSPMSFFDWKNLLPNERNAIDYLANQGRFLPYLSPFHEEEFVDKETSVGLRKDGEVIGWSITRRPNPLTIRYSSLYVDSSLLHSGIGIQLLVESIRRHKQLPIPHAIFEVNLMEIDPSWWRFVKRRLMPMASKIEHLKKAMRILTIYLE